MGEEQNALEVVSKSLVEDYIKQTDWRVNENANMAYSLQGLNNYIKEEVSKYYWMNYIYSPRVKQAHVDGRIHLHDSGSLSGYCMGLDLEDLLEGGFYGGPGKVRSGAPKHLRAALGQLVNLMYSATGECYADGTEVLTETGWKDLKDVAVGESVFTVNIQTKRMEWKPVLRTINKAYSGDMLHFKNRFMDFMVTPDHNMVVRPGMNLKSPQHYHLVKAKDVRTNGSHTLPCRFDWDAPDQEFFTLKGYTTTATRKNRYKPGTTYPVTKTVQDVKIPMDDWLRFLGCYISEGNLASRKDIDKRRGVPRIEYCVVLGQAKYVSFFRDACNAVAKCLSKKACETVFYKNNGVERKLPLHRWIIYDKALYTELTPLGNAYTMYIPEYIYTLSKRQLRIFVEALMYGDGGTADKDYYMMEYYSTSKALIDGLQRIFTQLGYSTSIQSKFGPKSTTPLYILRRHKFSLKKYDAPERVQYTGTVRCVETENGTLLVRYGNKVNWCGNCAGAIAVSNLDTLMAPFIYYDSLSKAQVKQAIQEFIYNMNVPTRCGYQSVFSNCTLDFTVPNHFADKPVLVGGKRLDKTYKEFQKEMDLFNECFFEVMNAGDSDGRIFSFPIPTVNVTKNFDWDNPRYNAMWQNTAKYGQPYFCNYVSSDMDPADAMSMCPLAEDTLVPTINKDTVIVKKIRDIQVGEYVYDANGKPSLVVGTTLHRNMLGIKVTTSTDAVIEFGAEHLQPIYRNNEYMVVPAKEIRIGDKLLGYNVFLGDDNSKYSISQENSPAVMKLEHAGYLNDYYCITVDNENHLFRLANGIITHNCRLRIDLKELKRKGGLFGANPLTGSVSVCTINFPRLGYLHKNDEVGFFKELDELLDIAKEALETRRARVEEWTAQGMFPILKYYLRKTYARFGKYWTNHFSTIATVGMNECCLNMFGYSIGDPKGKEFALKVMNYLRSKAVEFQTETGHQYNIEQAPAEATSFRLAKIDKKKYPDIIVADNETVEKEGAAPFYTNSTQLPVNYTDDIFELMDNQAEINALYTGGSVQHLYLGERVKDIEAMKQLIKAVFTNYEIPYISITPTFSVCPVHGYLAGEHQYCPTCKTEAVHKLNLEEERLKSLLSSADK